MKKTLMPPQSSVLDYGSPKSSSGSVPDLERLFRSQMIQKSENLSTSVIQYLYVINLERNFASNKDRKRVVIFLLRKRIARDAEATLGQGAM